MNHDTNHLDKLRNSLHCDGVVLWHVFGEKEIRPIGHSWKSRPEEWQKFCAESNHATVLSKFLHNAESARTCDFADNVCQRVDLFRKDGVHGLFVVEFLWAAENDAVSDFQTVRRAIESDGVAASRLISASSQPSINNDDSKTVSEFVQSLHQSLDLKEAAVLAANSARQFCGSQRVSIAVQRGAALKLVAVSGSDKVSHRSEEVRLLSTLAQAVFRSGASLRWSSGDDERESLLRRLIADYVQTSHARSVMMEILIQQEPVIRDDAPATRRRNEKQSPRPLGVIIFEQFDSASIAESQVAQQRVAAAQIEQSLSNARLHSSVFLRRPLLAIGRTLNWFRGRRLAIASAVVSAFTVFAVACFILPWEYKVSCDGELMPDEHATIYAPWEGQVVELFVEHNDSVSLGQPLLQLRNDDLQQEFVAVKSKVAELQKLVRSYGTQLEVAGRSGTKDDAVKIQGELTRTKIELLGAEEQATVLSSRVESLLVKSPRKGVIATFDLRHSFQDRPVTRGERLIEIFNPDGEWHLELRIPEHRSRYVAQIMQVTDNQAEVEFVMATDVSRTHSARLKSTATIVDTSEKEGLVIRSFAQIPELASIGPKQFGSEVHSKIHCGKELLGWCLFGDVAEFIQRHVWF